jgi:chromosome segregation ATPase
LNKELVMHIGSLSLSSFVVVASLSLLVGGCANNKGSAAQKRESDRTAMRLADAEKQRDEARAQLTQAQAQMEAARTELKKAQAELAAAQKGAQGTADVRKQLDAAQASLNESQQQLQKAEASNQEMARKLAETNKRLEQMNARMQQQPQPAGATTRPSHTDLNK